MTRMWHLFSKRVVLPGLFGFVLAGTCSTYGAELVGVLAIQTPPGTHGIYSMPFTTGQWALGSNTRALCWDEATQEYSPLAAEAVPEHGEGFWLCNEADAPVWHLLWGAPSRADTITNLLHPVLTVVGNPWLVPVEIPAAHRAAAMVGPSLVWPGEGGWLQSLDDTMSRWDMVRPYAEPPLEVFGPMAHPVLFAEDVLRVGFLLHREEGDPTLYTVLSLSADEGEAPDWKDGWTLVHQGILSGEDTPWQDPRPWVSGEWRVYAFMYGIAQTGADVWRGATPTAENSRTNAQTRIVSGVSVRDAFDPSGLEDTLARRYGMKNASMRESLRGRRVFFVDAQNGQDGFDGIYPQAQAEKRGPLRTLSKAAQVVGPSDTLVIADGHYDEAQINLAGVGTVFVLGNVSIGRPRVVNDAVDRQITEE